MPHILCGDFNSFDFTKSGKELKTFQYILGEDYVDAAEHVGVTADLFNMDIPDNPAMEGFVKKLHIHIAKKIDYMWVKKITIISCKKLTLRGSDHYPLVGEFSLQ
jgi:endonuclease/exonuclease/phosphatase family metal-dependent hydrolase